MEQAIPEPRRRYTEAEYLAFEEASDTKHEFRNGQIIPFGGWERDPYGRIIGMAGGTAEHSDIAGNVFAELKSRLAGTPCRVNNSGLRVRVSRSGRYCYPDVIVTCQPRAFHTQDRRVTLVNPQVVIEVLSPSTADDDRGDKFRDYIAIDSLQEYVLVAQDRPRVETFYRRPDDGAWAIGPAYEGFDATLPFPSLGVTVPLAQIYAGVDLPPSAP
jgi:Uma2 family endonuclease